MKNHPGASAKKGGAPRRRVLDVRALIAEGGNPFERIVATVDALAPGEDLTLITPFLPAPMIEKLRSDGFAARPERRADGAWQTQFTRGVGR